LAEQAKKDRKLQVIILTGDRDLLQLVDKNVLIIAPITGVTKTVLFDEEKVREKYGLEPHQLIDYKSLVGDASDNYPGVSGIGPKTASDLVKRFHTLEGIYENLAEIAPGVQLKLANDAEQAALAKKLATIERNAPVKLHLRESEMAKADMQAMFLAFNELGFRSLIARFGSFDSVQKFTKQNEPKKLSEAKSASGGKDDDEQLGLL